MRWKDGNIGIQLCVEVSDNPSDRSSWLTDWKGRVSSGEAILIPNVGDYAAAFATHAAAQFHQRTVDLYFGGDNVPDVTAAQFGAALAEIARWLDSQ